MDKVRRRHAFRSLPGVTLMANVRVSSRGKLFFDFRYRKIRCREYTLLNDTAANRRLVALTEKQIGKDIAAGTFSCCCSLRIEQQSEVLLARN